MVLGKLPVSGCPTILVTVGQGPTALAVGAACSAWGCLDIFTLVYPFSPLSPRSGGGVVDNTLDYQSRGRKIDPPLFRTFG